MQRIYYAAVMVKTTVHIAATKYAPDQYVHCDAIREKIFGALDKQPELVIFDSHVYAQSHAENNYYAAKALGQNGLFDDGKVQHSNNAELVRIYGDHTFMKKTAMVTIYSFECDCHVSDLGPSARYKDGSATYGYTVKPENKHHLKLTHAQMGSMMYYTEQSIKEGKSKEPVVNLLNHDALTRKFDIPVIGGILRKFF